MAYIPNKLYVGFRADGEDTLTCFMTPLANDSAFAKRKQTIDDWSSKSMKSVEISNDPRTGFRLVDTSRRWNSNNVVFRVIHPEVGAEFEISAENLSNIMSNTDILKGEIQDKLLIIREGAKNILVIDGSPEHLGSSQVDENGKEIFLKKDEYAVGDILSLKGHGQAVYFGKDTVHYTDITVNNGFSGVKLRDQSENGYVLYFADSKHVRILSTAPKVLKNHGTSGLTINDMIGENLGYGSIIYDIGNIKDPSKYEYKLIPSKIKYGYALIKNGSTLTLCHKSSERYSTYCDLTLRDDGEFVTNGVLANTYSYQSASNVEFFQVTKVLK